MPGTPDKLYEYRWDTSRVVPGTKRARGFDKALLAAHETAVSTIAASAGSVIAQQAALFLKNVVNCGETAQALALSVDLTADSSITCTSDRDVTTTARRWIRPSRAVMRVDEGVRERFRQPRDPDG
jgi:hypothetical protein